MKRFTSILFAALIAVVSYAQKPVLATPKTLIGGGNSIGKVVTNVRDLSAKNLKKAPRKAASDYVIITEQPEGELKQFTRSGNYLYVNTDDEGNRSLAIGPQSGMVDMVVTEDGKIYIKDPLMGGDYDTWVEGTYDDENQKLVVAVPQNLLYVSTYDACIALIPIDSYSTADETATEITYSMSVSDDGTRLIFTLDGFTSYNRTLGAYWTDDQSIQLYGEYNTVFTEVLDGDKEVVEAPEDLETEEYALTARNYEDNKDVSLSILIGFDGNDVYIQGLSTMLPEAWVKGTLEGNTVTFATGQYLGNYYDTYDMYLNVLMNEDVVFTYDSETGTFTAQNEFFLVDNSQYYFDSYRNAIIKKVVEKAATPANPSITALTNGNYGYYITFNVPNVDTNGDGLVASKLSYIIYTDIEHTVSPLTFTPETHSMLTENMTEIPFGFTEDYDIYSSQIYLNDLYSEDWNKIGIKSIYRGGGEEHETEIQWYTIKAYTLKLAANTVDGTNYYTTYFETENNRQADANTTVYYATLNESQTWLKLNAISNRIIPVNTAVILESTNDEISLTEYTGNVSRIRMTIKNNVLKGAATETAVESGKTYYVLGAENSKVGFYKFAGTTLAAGKAYIELAGDAAVKVLGFDEATGISTVEVANAENGAIYNLAGQRMNKAQKGVFIVNGKKVVLK